MQEPSPYNFHKEIRKTITLIAGILLLFAGVFMLYKGTNAAGTLDFTTTLVKGKLETGSAGALAIVFGILVIYLANHHKDQDVNSTSSGLSPIVRMLIQCKQLPLIVGFAMVLVLLVLVYLLEPLRMYLLGLIGIILLLIFCSEPR